MKIYISVLLNVTEQLNHRESLNAELKITIILFSIYSAAYDIHNVVLSEWSP